MIYCYLDRVPITLIFLEISFYLHYDIIPIKITKCVKMNDENLTDMLATVFETSKLSNEELEKSCLNG